MLCTSLRAKFLSLIYSSHYLNGLCISTYPFIMSWVLGSHTMVQTTFWFSPSPRPQCQRSNPTSLNVLLLVECAVCISHWKPLFKFEMKLFKNSNSSSALSPSQSHFFSCVQLPFSFSSHGAFDQHWESQQCIQGLECYLYSQNVRKTLPMVHLKNTVDGHS